MFGFFKKKPTIVDAAIREIYGDNPPAKSAVLEHAVTLAYEGLLFEQIPRRDVERLATSLFNGPMPYSTHDLAVSTAHAFFSASHNIEKLSGCQLAARACVLSWLKAGQVAPMIAWAFESALYVDYKPAVSAEADL
ncbi:hypothetical protein [Bosea sp. (in: a-proteobacteria)]|jgi:hypothetical protein|uniref:hypothetical protein n=1 Tax=Bosea sp. (in: a-proteobacteria) TaxID=1871050 RepID=UPI003F72EC7F